MIVIHASGAELAALLTGQVGTGGQVETHGPIPQGSLRKHFVKAISRAVLLDVPLADAPYAGTPGSRIELLVTDREPVGDPDRYTPSAATDRYVRWRDQVCQFPGCNRPAEYTDLDHRIAFAAGGRTTAANLHCLCRHHHRLKHEGNWQIHRNPDHTYTWTSPTGRRYRGPDEPHKATDP